MKSNQEQIKKIIEKLEKTNQEKQYKKEHFMEVELGIKEMQ